MDDFHHDPPSDFDGIRDMYNQLDEMANRNVPQDVNGSAFSPKEKLDMDIEAALFNVLQESDDKVPASVKELLELLVQKTR